MPYDKGDFTQQGIDGKVAGGLLLNNKRDVDVLVTTNEDDSTLGAVAVTIEDHLNDLHYAFFGENLEAGEVYEIGAGGGGTSITPILTLNLTTNTSIKMFNTVSLVLENNKLRSGEILTGIHEIIPYTGLQYAPEGYNFVIGEALSATLTDAVNCTLVEDDGIYLISITNPDQNASATLNVSFEDID